MTLAQPGTVSHGTMRPEDLLETLGTELQRLDTDLEYRDLAQLAQDTHRQLVDAQSTGVPAWLFERAHYAIDELFDALDTFAPEGHYFGGHEGDGTDYGYWRYEV